MAPKRKAEPAQQTGLQVRQEKYVKANEQRRTNAANAAARSQGEDKTHQLTAEQVGVKIANSAANKSSVKSHEHLERAKEVCADELGRAMIAGLKADELELLKSRFGKPVDTKTFSLSDLVKHVHKGCADGNYKPRFRLMDEEVTVTTEAVPAGSSEAYPMVSMSRARASLQRELCWTPKQANGYLLSLIHWEGSSTANASVMPVPMPPVFVYHDAERDEYQIFAGQHRIAFAIAFYLARIPVVGASGEGDADARYLFQSCSPADLDEAYRNRLYPPFAKKFLSYWKLHEQGFLNCGDDNLFSTVFRAIDSWVQGVTQKRLQDTYQHVDSHTLCYNFQNKGIGRHETFNDAFEVRTGEDGSTEREQIYGDHIVDWHKRLGEVRLQFAVFSKESTTVDEVKVLSNMDNVRIPNESLGVWFLQTPGTFNDTLKLFEPMLMKFLAACAYPDGSTPDLLYRHNELRWVLAARLAICLEMGFGTCAKPNMQYADLAREVQMIRDIVVHHAFEWDDPTRVAARIATTLRLMTMAVQKLSAQGKDDPASYLCNFYYDEYRFFTVAIVVHHWVGMLPVDADGRITVNAFTESLLMDVCMAAFLMASVVFTYEKKPSAKRSDADAPAAERVPIDDQPYEYHADLRMMRKPGGGAIDVDGRGDFHFIYEFFQNGYITKSGQNRESLAPLIDDEHLRLFHNAGPTFKKSSLAVQDGRFVTRPLDICANLLRDAGTKAIDTYQRSSIGILANIFSVVTYAKYKKRFTRLFREENLVAPAHYAGEAKGYIYAIIISPRMQRVTEACVDKMKCPSFKVGDMELEAVAKSRPKAAASERPSKARSTKKSRTSGKNKNAARGESDDDDDDDDDDVGDDEDANGNGALPEEAVPNGITTDPDADMLL